MPASNQQIEERSSANVPALADEIVERLASTRSSRTAELRQVRREFSRRLKDAAPHVPNSLIHGWAASADRWWRRAALVSTVPLNSKARGGTGDAHRTLQVCRLLERDRDPMVAKALSWALRELAKRDARAVREYLSSRKDVLPALVLREVKNKLRTGVKNPKKR